MGFGGFGRQTRIDTTRMVSLLKKLIGSRNDRLLKQYRRQVVRINALEAALEKLDDAQLAAKTDEFRQQYKDGKSLDALLPEAFAVVREGSKRDRKSTRLNSSH